MKKMQNAFHIEGYLYQHDLEKKVTGDTSANPGTEYITGSIEVATDSELLNIVPVSFIYVTEKTSKGNDNPTYTILNGILNKTLGSITEHGVDKAAKLRIDTSIGLNEWYNVGNNNELELVSNMRNIGGFVHQVSVFNENEEARNEAKCDILITNVKAVDGDADAQTKDCAVVSGYIFDFKGALLPASFKAYSSGAMNYYLGLEATPNKPVLTNITVRQIATTVVTTTTEETAFSGPYVKTTKRTRKEYEIVRGRVEPYDFGEDGIMTEEELRSGLANRELYLASLKTRREESLKKKAAATSTSATATPTTDPGSFKF